MFYLLCYDEVIQSTDRRGVHFSHSSINKERVVQERVVPSGLVLRRESETRGKRGGAERKLSFLSLLSSSISHINGGYQRIDSWNHLVVHVSKTNPFQSVRTLKNQ